MTRAAFEQLVEEALLDIPERFRRLMDNVAVLVEDRARVEHGEEVGIRRGEVLLGLYQGVPLTARGPHYSLVPPDKITIFQDAISALGKTETGIKALVRDTVWHEVAHHFGAEETRVRAAERRRRKRHA